MPSASECRMTAFVSFMTSEKITLNKSIPVDEFFKNLFVVFRYRGGQ